MWKTSEFMNAATNTQKYITNYTILVPATWSHDAAWHRTSGETFERGRILVKEGFGESPDEPNTLQPGDCGQEGDYTHLTPNFLLASDSEFPFREKTMVHHWGHLKWGLLDEKPTDEDIKWYSYRRRLYPTRCTTAIDGIVRDATREQSNFACLIALNGLFTDTCQFIEDLETSSRASIMYREDLSSVDSFCNSDPDSPADLTHDSLAPSKQNRRCEMSTWDTLNFHEDFATDTSNLEFLNEEPVAYIVQDYDPELVATTTSTTSTTTTTAAPTTVATSTSTSTTSTTTPTTTATSSEPVVTTVSTTTESPVEPTADPFTGPPRKPDVVCLVLDVSGSMNSENRINIMGSAVANYLRNYLETGSVVGIVQFNTAATVAKGMTVIVNDTTRDELVNAVPTVAGGGTSIGSGMVGCKEELLAYAGEDVASTRMFVLSDGQESSNSSPNTAEALPEIIELGITVDTIAYSQSADPVLGSVALLTGGYSFYFSGSQVSTAMQDALLATIERRRNLDTPVTLVSSGIMVPARSNYTQTVPLDISIGRDTRLVFTYYSQLDVHIDAPPANQVKITRDTAFKLISVQLSGVVTGEVTFTLDNTQSFTDENVVVSVTTRAGVLGQDPITASARLSTNYLSFDAQSTVNIFADVFQGLNPVSGVNVSAIFELPTSSELTIIMTDNGVGTDMTAGDGVYSGTIRSNQLVNDGFYSLKIDVEGFGELAVGTIAGRRKKRAVSTGPLSRVASGGMFQVEGFDLTIASQDNFAPSKITDLRIVESIYGTDYFTFGWTAPGNDLTYGTAAGYEMSVWYDTHANKTLNDSVILAPEAMLRNNWSTTLQPAGEFVNITVLVGGLNNSFFGLNETDETEIDTYFFKLRAFDEAGNMADWSNEISASFVNPADYLNPVTIPGSTSVTVPTTAVPPGLNTTLIAIAVALSVCLLGLIVGITIALLVCFKKKKNQVDPERERFSHPSSGNPTPPVAAVG
ncbi:calcium-activated chloride channel regulator 1-like [Watersipora subatra]|uniref:calcium-activated chloride channel regulator 1-like n=1 Tax=Watersipora subatra TaxID=2589382 RepID=UPI00355B5AB0